MSTLTVEDLVIQAKTSSGALTIIDGVSLELAPGELVGVVGESGSGKTTLIRAVLGLLDRNLTVIGGQIAVSDEIVLTKGSDDTPSVRGSQVGMIFQDATRSLNPLLKVSYQMRETVRAHRSGLSKQEVDRLCSTVLSRMMIEDTARVLGSYPHELSGGMCQRIGIALAVLTEPELVLADECTTALDVTTQAEVVSLLRELVDSTGLAMVFVTHDLLLAGDLCDRLVVMKDGRIVETGQTDRILAGPSDPYTKRLLEAIPAWDGPTTTVDVGEGG